MTLFSKLDHSGGAESSYKVVQVHGVTAGGAQNSALGCSRRARKRYVYPHSPERVCPTESLRHTFTTRRFSPLFLSIVGQVVINTNAAGERRSHVAFPREIQSYGGKDGLNCYVRNSNLHLN